MKTLILPSKEESYTALNRVKICIEKILEKDNSKRTQVLTRVSERFFLLRLKNCSTAINKDTLQKLLIDVIFYHFEKAKNHYNILEKISETEWQLNLHAGSFKMKNEEVLNLINDAVIILSLTDLEKLDVRKMGKEDLEE